MTEPPEASVGERFRRLVRTGGLDLPGVATGATATRHRRLFDLARQDLPLARLAEAHVDAVAILTEAGRSPAPGVGYGVWASEDPGHPVALTGDDRQPPTLDGTKAFCTGAGIVQRALVTVRRDDEVLLVDVDVGADRGVGVDASSWTTAAFADTSTARVTFDRLPIDERDVVGPPGWYLDRPGFWHGACGPAACWAGGAAGLVDWATATLVAGRPDPHRDAHLGALHALVWRMRAVLDVAGDEIDQDPDDQPAARRRALAVRHGIERDCVEILDRVGRALGPRPLAFEPAVERRWAEVQLYVRQCHAERDLAALGQAVRSANEPPALVTPP